MKTITVNTMQEFEEVFSKALVDGAQVKSVRLAFPKIEKERFDMRRLALFVSLAIITIIVGYISVQAYNNVKTRQEVSQAAAAVEAKVSDAKSWATKQVYNARVSSLQDQCQKDHQLFVQTNGRSPNGDCDPSLPVLQ